MVIFRGKQTYELDETDLSGVVGGLGDPKLIFNGIWKKAYGSRTKSLCTLWQTSKHFTRKRLWGMIRIEAIRSAGGGLVVWHILKKKMFLEMRVSGDVSEIRKSRFAHFG